MTSTYSEMAPNCRSHHNTWPSILPMIRTIATPKTSVNRWN